MPAAGPATLRERRKQHTRREIRRVALGLVQERGIDAVTVDLISERAGVSVRTFFNYYACKESAMIATPPPIPPTAASAFLARSGLHDLFVDLTEVTICQMDEGGSIPSDFESSMQIVMGVPALAKLQLGAFVELEKQFVELIAARLKLGVDDEAPAVYAAAFMGAVRVAGQRWARNPDRSLGEEIRRCVQFLSAAHPKPAGRIPGE
ncbi:MAG: TetR/AcrR family transcriptional regulator [Mycobacterium sp.]